LEAFDSKNVVQMKSFFGVGPESEMESESDNRNCPESESESVLESDDETSDSTALVTRGTVHNESFLPTY